jgi:beta-lactamase regulating signal transducer with metallopeptidase domain
MLQRIFSDIIEVALITSGVIAILLLLLPFLRRHYTARWRSWVWLLVAVRLLIPFNPSLPQAPIQLAAPAQHMTVNVSARETTVLPPQMGNPVSSPVATPVPVMRATVPLTTILSLVWILGIAAFLLYHFMGYFLFRRAVRRFSRPVEDERTLAIWNAVRREMHVVRPIQLLSCKKVQSPMMTGFFHPVLLLPDTDHSDTGLHMILKHELVHYKRGDIWYKLLMICANAVHWFNPLVYLVVTASNQDLEMSSDSAVIQDADIASRKQYSETILAAVRKGKMRQTAFSTYFDGGKKTMKERLVNIFDVNRRRKGLLALCAIIIVVGITGALVAYDVSDQSEQKAIDNVALLKAGNSYYLEIGKFIISYGVRKSAVVSLAPDTNDQAAYFGDKAIYISDEVTAVAYGGNTGSVGTASPVTVLISNNEGQTWSNYSVADTKADDYYPQKYVGFTTKNDGWLLLAGSAAMGHQENRIFQTSDGGKTWTEIGNTNQVYPRVVTGAGFANKNIGFVSFRYDVDPNPIVYRTKDKGKTWTQCVLEIPDSFKSIATYATALSPVFDGAKGILPVTFRNNDAVRGTVDVTVQYITSDYGKTWTFNEKYNLALIWADAWKTRDGKGRYEIMSSQMQADFRAQQELQSGKLIFVIRGSSPWVVSYDVALDGEQAVVTYWYADSGLETYKGVERLTFGEENGRIVVTGCKTEIEMEAYTDTSDWKAVDTGLYTFSIPPEWEAQALADGSVSFIFTPNSEELGSLTRMSYYSSLPLSQFEGNHAQTLSTETLNGCKYPATMVMIRRTQPAAANDNSYVDELHIYLIPENSKFAYDLYFDSSLVNQEPDEIAKSMVINTNRIQIQDMANQWGEAVQNRDGKAQYDLMSPELQKRVYEGYQERNWVTGQSSPWVDGYTVKPGDNTAAVTYTYMTSTGFAGYYLQMLSFVTENGQSTISDYTEPKQANGQSGGTVLAYLDDGRTWLSAAMLHEGMFSDMTLSIDGKTKRFPWKTYGELAFLPELSYADVDGDGRNELIVILCESEGTGALVEEIHVLNPEDFSEITVQSPLAALENRVVSKIDENDVQITIDNQNALVFPEKEITAKVAEKKSWFANLATGSIIDYSMQGNNVIVRVAAQLSPSGFLGDFNLTYEYKDNQLKVSGVSFMTALFWQSVP